LPSNLLAKVPIKLLEKLHTNLLSILLAKLPVKLFQNCFKTAHKSYP
jgi:hypothetical protein